MPIIYLSFLCTGAFAFLLGNGIRLITRRSHNRNFKSRVGLAIFAGLFAIYCAWTAYILWALGAQGPSDFGVYASSLGWLFTEPDGYFAIINEIGKVGMWSIGDGDNTVSGTFLYVIWAIESLMLLVIPVMLVWNSDTFPYSENLNKIYEKHTLNLSFGTVVSSQRFYDELSTDVAKAFENIGSGEPWRHTTVHVYYLENDPDAYLDFESVLIEEQGKGKTQKALIIENFKISKADAKSLMVDFGTV